MDVKENIVVNWPGWSLGDNKFGKDFDAEARVRMIHTGRKILPYILKNIHNLGEKYLEVGPFFTPILCSEEFPKDIIKNVDINFLENDRNVIKWLKLRFNCKVLDLNLNSDVFASDLKLKMKELFDVDGNFFDSIVISQVMNYVDYKELLTNIFSILNVGGNVFINNVVDYGIPMLFSRRRPKSNQEIVEIVKAIGFKIRYKEELPKTFSCEPYNRLIMILSKD